MNEKTKKTCAGIAAAAVAATLIGLWACTSESTHPAGIGSYAGSGSAGSTVVALATGTETGSTDESAVASAEGSSALENQASADCRQDGHAGDHRDNQKYWSVDEG